MMKSKNSLLDCKLPPKNNNYDEEAVILKESIKSVLDDLKRLMQLYRH